MSAAQTKELKSTGGMGGYNLLQYVLTETEKQNRSVFM
jgi:hypothetical protein